jgi:integrase
MSRPRSPLGRRADQRRSTFETTKNGETEGRTLTREQAQQLLEMLKKHRHESLYLLMLSTGMRRGETLGLKWEDLNFESGVVRVKRNLKREGGRIVTADTKTLKSRRAVNVPTPVWWMTSTV